MGHKTIHQNAWHLTLSLYDSFYGFNSTYCDVLKCHKQSLNNKKEIWFILVCTQINMPSKLPYTMIYKLVEKTNKH